MCQIVNSIRLRSYCHLNILFIKINLLLCVCLIYDLILILFFLINTLKCCKTHKNFNENDEKNVEKKIKKKKTSKKKINCQTKNENITIVNVINENFVVHRRLLLTIAIKMIDRKKNKNFIVDNATKKIKILLLTMQQKKK